MRKKNGRRNCEGEGVIVCYVTRMTYREWNACFFLKNQRRVSFANRVTKVWRIASSRLVIGSSVLVLSAEKLCGECEARNDYVERYSIRLEIGHVSANTYLYRYKLYMSAYIYDARVLPREFRGLERGNGSPTRVCRD